MKAFERVPNDEPSGDAGVGGEDDSAESLPDLGLLPCVASIVSLECSKQRPKIAPEVELQTPSGFESPRSESRACSPRDSVEFHEPVCAEVRAHHDGH